MENLIGLSEVTVALVLSFGVALLLECLLLEYVIHAIAKSTARPAAEPASERVVTALRRAGGI